MLLRPWRDSDREPFAALNADPRVMEYFPSTLTRVESDAMVDRIQAGFLEHGWGLWAVEVRGVDLAADIRHFGARQTSTIADERRHVAFPTAEFTGDTFVGYVGLASPRFDAHFTPCVEVGWRLARHAWGFGFATEAALAVCRFAFDQLGLKEVVSFTAAVNKRSIRVMQRLGMTHNPDDDFDHPSLPVGHQLRRHVLYRINRQTPGPEFWSNSPSISGEINS